MPDEVINFFEDGSFVCSINGNNMHSVALDEAHEMLVNKDLKTTVVRPTKEYIDRIIYYYPVRSQALKVLKQQLLLDGINLSENQFCILDTSTHSSRVEENVKCMSECIQSAEVLDTSGEKCEELTSLSGQVATPEQKNDLLSFWEIGRDRFENKLYCTTQMFPKDKLNYLHFLVLKS